jgi:RimJ/RimL family protein N-acetyltransferase
VIALRPATDDDVAFLVTTHEAPHARGFVLSATSEQVSAALRRDDRMTFVITENGEDAGMLLLAIEPELSWLVEFRRIVVVRPGRGIGAFAVRWAIDWAFDLRGAHRIWLDVVASNARARQLYERCGFRYEGTYRDGYRDDEGRYGDLCVYGMLSTDSRPPAG